MSHIDPLALIVLSVVLGACVGSFLNVVIHRLPQKKSIVFPASHCPVCFGNIRWYDNVPILSYLLLRGKCRDCRSKIPFTYPLVECLTAVCFFTTLALNEYSLDLVLLRNLIFACMGIVIFFIDLKHYIIPDVLSLPLFAIGCIFAFLTDFPGWQSAIGGSAFSFFMFYLLSYAYFKLKKTIGLGGGDIKYIAGIGMFVGFLGVLFVLLFSAFFALLCLLVMSIFSSKKGNDTPATDDTPPANKVVPYAPFLSIFAFLYLLLHDKLNDLYADLLYLMVY